MLTSSPIRWGQVAIWIVLSLSSAGGIVTALLLTMRKDAAAAEVKSVSAPVEKTKLTRPDENTLNLPSDVFTSLGLHVTEAVRPRRPRSLNALNGNLALDMNKLVRIHTRLPGEVVSLGLNEKASPTGMIQDGVSTRPLRVGDWVYGPRDNKPGQLLAVVWSKDLGEKKSELVDAVSRLKLDRETLSRLRQLDKEGATPARSLREAERNVEIDLINQARVERTLRSWRLSDAEIDAIKAEADRLGGKEAFRAGDHAAWARVEVRAPQDGVILEKNLAPGDLVDTSADLFKIADLTRLTVWVHVYEEDLPALLKMKRPIPWTIRIPSRPDAVFEGHLEQIGAVIDPTQHTALVSGQVENSRGELRVGQFVTATINLTIPEDEIEVPTGAVVEDGRRSILFVQPDPAKLHFERREVEVVRRFHDVVYVRTSTLPEQTRVVATGAVLLNDALENLPVKP